VKLVMRLEERRVKNERLEKEKQNEIVVKNVRGGRGRGERRGEGEIGELRENGGGY